MEKSISITELNKLATNYRSNKDIRFITNAAFIKITQLESFIADARTKHPLCDTLQINFIRFPLEANQENILSAGNGLSQVSLMFFPVRTINLVEWIVETVNDENGEILTLSINEPGINIIERTNGLCPPKGNCQ